MVQFRCLVPFALFAVAVSGAVTACAPTTASGGSGGSAMSSSGGNSASGGTTATGTGGGSTGPASGGATASGGSVGSGGTSSTGGDGASASGGSGSGGATSGSGGSAAGGATRPDAGAASGGRAGPDAGMTTDAAVTATCPAGVLLCDDFESYSAGTAPTGPWKTTTKGAGAAVVDTKQAYSGTKAVHFSGSVNKDEAYIRASKDTTAVFPVNANQIFIRFMMYVQTYPNASPMHVRFSWVGTTGVANNMDGSGYTMCTYNGVAVERIASGYLRDTSQAMTQTANQNKWVCWEWEISNTEGPASGGTGKVLPRIWREGTALSLNFSGNTKNWDPAPFDLVQFSLFAYQSDSNVANYWFDDIAVSTSRIGCPTAK